MNICLDQQPQLFIKIMVVYFGAKHTFCFRLSNLKSCLSAKKSEKEA